MATPMLGADIKVAPTASGEVIPARAVTPAGQGDCDQNALRPVEGRSA